MVRSLCLLLAFLFFSLPLLANIGETLSEIKTRYGAAKEVSLRTKVFHWKDYSVTVYFNEQDRSRMEVFSLRDDGEEDDSLSERISPRNVQKLLLLQGEGKAWRTIKKTREGNTFLRSDSLVFSRHEDPVVIFLTYKDMASLGQ